MVLFFSSHCFLLNSAKLPLTLAGVESIALWSKPLVYLWTETLHLAHCRPDLYSDDGSGQGVGEGEVVFAFSLLLLVQSFGAHPLGSGARTGGCGVRLPRKVPVCGGRHLYFGLLPWLTWVDSRPVSLGQSTAHASTTHP